MDVSFALPHAKNTRKKRAVKEALRKAKKREDGTKYRAEKPDKVRASNAKYYEKNFEKLRECRAKYREENPEKVKAALTKHREENPDKVNAIAAKRRAAKLLATPTWSSKEAIQAFYTRAMELTQLTGILHVVDHIIPLQGKTVCGLHVEFNLQVLTESENCSKNNRIPVEYAGWIIHPKVDHAYQTYQNTSPGRPPA